MLTVSTLKSYTVKDLGQMAKKRGISGWHSMRKDQLVRALAKATRNGKATSTTRSKAANSSKTTSAKSAAAKTGKRSATVSGQAGAATAKQRSGVKGKTSNSSQSGVRATRSTTAKQGGQPAKSSPNGVRANRGGGTSASRRAQETPAPKPKSKGVIRKIQQVHQAREAKMDLATAGSLKANGAKNGNGHRTPTEDRIVLLVRDSYWLQACWELTPRCVERAQAALKEAWHNARPVLRLLSISNSNVSNNPECVQRVIDIHGAVHNWFIDVYDPPHTYRVEIGYLTAENHFYALARSNPVTTPRPGSADMLERNWVDLIDNPEKVYAMSGGYDEHASGGELQSLFEERLRRPMGSPMITRFGNGAEAALNRARGLEFTIDAEMVVYGMTSPNAYVTMSGEPVKLRADGTFVARVSLPDRRQVIPIVASSGDGVEERTIVLAVEKNTKVMEPKMREPGE